MDAGTGGLTLTNVAEGLRSDASDPDLSNNEASASLVVNRAPQANDDTASTPEDHPVAVDVLANDSDPDGSLDLSSLTATVQPAQGVLTVDQTSGMITYTPASDWHGADSFEYEICDDDADGDTTALSTRCMSQIRRDCRPRPP